MTKDTYVGDNQRHDRGTRVTIVINLLRNVRVQIGSVSYLLRWVIPVLAIGVALLVILPRTGGNKGGGGGTTPPPTGGAGSTVVSSEKTIIEDWGYRRLTVLRNGEGSVLQSPPSNDGVYQRGVYVTLDAQPSTGWEFHGWTGAVTSASPQVSVLVDADKTVSATFGTQLRHVLTVRKIGEGAFVQNPPPDSDERYKKGISITVTALPAPGWEFDAWSGAASGKNATVSVVMDSDKSLIATFKLGAR